MPFTFSHPAILLPLHKLRWFSATGLIIGSMVPDYEYFLRMQVKSQHSHTLWGLLYFDLPLGILLAFLFHNAVRNHFIDHLPNFFKSRFIQFKQFNWNLYFQNYWWSILISFLIGAASHLLWDSFTHADGYFVNAISSLKNPINLFGNSVPIFKILQHCSSLLGAVFILLFIKNLPKQIISNRQGSWKYWLIVFSIKFFFVALKIFTGLHFTQIGNLLVTTIAAFQLGILFTPFILKRN